MILAMHNECEGLHPCISHIKNHLFKENGEFDEPDWDGYECVVRKFQTAYSILVQICIFSHNN